MGRGGLRYFVVWFGFHCMDQIRKLDRVLNKEHRHVVADEIVVSFLRVELHCEPTDVACKIG